MRVTVIRDDGVVGVDGVFRNVNLSGMLEGVRAMQWQHVTGHVEYDEGSNTKLDTIDAIQSFIDLWNAAAPGSIPLTQDEMIAVAHARINGAYDLAVNALTAGYPQTEIDSWSKQESEARAWQADRTAPTPWIDSAATARDITRDALAVLILNNANALAPLHGALTGKRQSLRDAINALGPTPTQEQLDLIQWS